MSIPGARQVPSLQRAASVHAQAPVRCRALTTPQGFGRSGADFLPVQNGPETVGFDGGDAVEGVCLRFGGIITFSCSLSRLAAVQGSSLIVSLPRFIRRVERSECNTRPGESGHVAGDKTDGAGARAAFDRFPPFSVLDRGCSAHHCGLRFTASSV